MQKYGNVDSQVDRWKGRPDHNRRFTEDHRFCIVVITVLHFIRFIFFLRWLLNGCLFLVCLWTQPVYHYLWKDFVRIKNPNCLQIPNQLKAVLLKLGERCLIRANFGLFLWQCWEGAAALRVAGSGYRSYPEPPGVTRPHYSSQGRYLKKLIWTL